MFSQNLTLFFTFAAALITLFLGVIVFLHDRKGITHKIFFIHSLTGAVWAFINFFSIVASPTFSLFFIRGVIALAVPHVFLFFLFTANFPSEKLKLKKSYFWGMLLLMGVMIVIALSPYAFQEVKYANGQPIPIVGSLMPIFALTLLIFFIITVVLVVQKFRSSTGIVRRQWASIGAGFIIAYSLLISMVFLRVILFEDATYVPYSPLFILPIFIGAAYAILRHNLFNVRVIAAEIFVFIIILTSITQILLSERVFTFYLNIGNAFFLLIFGVLLIRSVLKEVKQREQLEILSKELAAANEQLKKLDQAKSEFISIASHQLRAPLTVIRGFISLVLEGTLGVIPKQAQDALKKASISADSLVRLVSDLLDLSRIESGKIQYDFEINDFKEVVSAVLDRLQNHAKEKGLSINLNVQDQIPKFYFDSDKFSEVVMNFVDNAIKYSPAGAVQVKQELITKSDKEFARLSVKDTGIGIAREDLPRLFGKFIRAQEAKMIDPNGMGLGLFFVKKVTEDHGGTVWVESKGIGKGSTFFAELPIRLTPPPPVAQKPEN